MATQSLFDVIYSSISTPIAVEHEQLVNQEEKLKIQSEQLQLQTQQQLQAGLAQIWGPGGQETAEKSFQSGNLADDAKMKATIQLYSRFDPKAALQMQSTMSLMDERKAIALQKGMWTAEQQTKMLSNAASAAMTSQEDYTAAFPNIVENMTPDQRKRFQLTGDLEYDRPVLNQLSMLSTTQNQQAKQAQSTAKDIATNAYHNAIISQKQTALQQGQQRIDLSAGREARLGEWQAHKEVEDGKRDARAQQGLDLKTSKQGNPATTKPVKANSPELQQAQDVFGNDPRTKDMPPSVRNTIAKEAAMKAAHDHFEMSFPDALETTMAQMEKEGRFKATGSSITGAPKFDYKGPKPTAANTAPAQKPSSSGYATLDALQQAVRAKALTPEQARKIAIEKGWAQ